MATLETCHLQPLLCARGVPGDWPGGITSTQVVQRKLELSPTAKTELVWTLMLETLEGTSLTLREVWDRMAWPSRQLYRPEWRSLALQGGDGGRGRGDEEVTMCF